MNRRFPSAALTALLLLTACAGDGGTPASTGAPSSTPTAAGTRHPYPEASGSVVGEAPVFRAESIEGQHFFNPGAAILHDGTYHAFGFAFDGDGTRAMHLTSTDAMAWEPAADPDWTTLGLELDQPGPIPTSVLVEPDGTWVVYGWGFLPGTNPAPTVAWRASGPGPDGPWVADPGIILEPGAGDAWDGRGLFALSVTGDGDGDGYRTAYAASSRLFPNHGVIGMATSADGVAWDKFDLPTASRELAESDPIVEEGLCGDYDAGAVFQPQLTTTEAGFRLLYSGFTIGAGPTTIVSAVSADGETWTCDGAVVTEGMLPDGATIQGFAVIRGDEGHLLVEALDEEGGASSLWLVAL